MSIFIAHLLPVIPDGRRVVGLLARKLLSYFCGQSFPNRLTVDSVNRRKVRNIPAVERIIRSGLSDASRYVRFGRFDYGLIPFAHLPALRVVVALSHGNTVPKRFGGVNNGRRLFTSF
jgi:hypothetical protein